MSADLPEGVRELLSLLPVSCAAQKNLVSLMSAADRYYHNLGHIELLWKRHRQFGPATEYGTADMQVLIASAIAYHDAVYDPERADNERNSADLWRRDAEATAKLVDWEIDWVAETIEATASHFDPFPTNTLRERARIWMLDLDLTPLGEPSPVFKRNTGLLRMEVPDLTDEEWDRRRLAFLARAGSNPRLFRTPVLSEVFEAQAQANIAKELRGRR